MPEMSKPVSVEKIEYLCDECGEGVCTPNGQYFPTCPPQYGHSCESCGFSITLMDAYPKIRYLDLVNESG